jgi:hypothetical protein
MLTDWAFLLTFFKTLGTFDVKHLMTPVAFGQCLGRNVGWDVDIKANNALYVRLDIFFLIWRVKIFFTQYMHPYHFIL